MQENSTNLSTFQAEEKILHKAAAHQSPAPCVHILKEVATQGPEQGLSKCESTEPASILKASISKARQNSTGTHRTLFISQALFILKT